MPRPLVPLQRVPKPSTKPGLVRGAVTFKSSAWTALSGRVRCSPMSRQ